MSSRENFGGYSSSNYEFHPVHVPVVAITVLGIICVLRMLIRCLSRNSVKEGSIYNRPSFEVPRDAGNPNRVDVRVQVPLSQEVSQPRRQLKCGLCLNHGEVALLKSHKRYCPWKACKCGKCANTFLQRKIDASNVAARRARAQDDEYAKQLILRGKINSSIDYPKSKPDIVWKYENDLGSVSGYFTDTNGDNTSKLSLKIDEKFSVKKSERSNGVTVPRLPEVFLPWVNPRFVNMNKAPNDAFLLPLTCPIRENSELDKIGLVPILMTAELVYAERYHKNRSSPPIRVCKEYQPLQINETTSSLSCSRNLTSTPSTARNLEADKNIIQISIENGYHIESYNVSTADGYILTTFRISGGQKSPPREGKPAVLLLHGWGTSSEVWFALPNDKNLANTLVDAGWDVWLGNHRGTSHSLGHNVYNSSTDVEYWDFSFHEMGLFDFPAMLNQALKASKNDKIFVIGYSQSGAAFLIGTSHYPEINDKIHAAYLMAPAAYMGGAREPSITSVIPYINTPEEKQIFDLAGGRFDLRNPQLIYDSLGLETYELCPESAQECGLCESYPSSPLKFHSAKMNYVWDRFNTNLARFTSKFFDIGNLKSTFHFARNVRSCEFQYYDYGAKENFRRYGTRKPPNYNLKGIKTPVYILFGEQDPTVTPSDIKKLASALAASTLRATLRVNDDSFGHLDFASASDAHLLVYQPLLKLMTEFLDNVK
ncbi:unnamed protein product [Orchesella dallaii]|uniref:DM domain-containing protein n=1 Tax=Orchesella dallaii TaxID=48710 RepID=A0ABP1RUX3_9HEXA